MMTDSTGLSFDGKVALVSGASRGIGRAIAIGLARAGAAVVGLARGTEGLAETGSEIGSVGGRFLPVPVDLGQVDRIAGAVETGWQWRGRIDVLVNAAGVISRVEAPEITEAIWDEVFAVNTRAAFFLCQAVGRRMLESESGAIINITSLAAQVTTGATVVYSASKAALVQMTRVLAVRWAPRVRVNAVGPGYVRTSLNQAWLSDTANLGYVLDRTPLQRVGDPTDVVGAVVFLASPAASYITGQHLLIDGGWSAR
jgi:NAD(P)-dependent dehydrogenase (short-subunit alcohol dehydrogenase family)